jgi:hypothetical protein
VSAFARDPFHVHGYFQNDVLTTPNEVRRTFKHPLLDGKVLRVHIRIGNAKMSLHLFLTCRIFGADFIFHSFFQWTYGVHHGTF